MTPDTKVLKQINGYRPGGRRQMGRYLLRQTDRQTNLRPKQAKLPNH